MEKLASGLPPNLNATYIIHLRHKRVSRNLIVTPQGALRVVHKILLKVVIALIIAFRELAPVDLTILSWNVPPMVRVSIQLKIAQLQDKSAIKLQKLVLLLLIAWRSVLATPPALPTVSTVAKRNHNAPQHANQLAVYRLGLALPTSSTLTR